MKRPLVLFGIVGAVACSLNMGFKGRPCPKDGNCGPGLSCVRGMCVEGSPEPDAGGSDGGETDGGGPVLCGSAVCRAYEDCVGASCVQRQCSQVTCDGGERCARGVCFPGSCGETECALGAVCIDGRCVHEGCAFVSCGADALCVRGQCVPIRCGVDGGVRCDGGEWCEASACVDTYCRDLTCPSGRCFRGACLALLPTETACHDGVDDDGDELVDCFDDDCNGRSCNDGNDCTIGDQCVEGWCQGSQASGTCTAPPGQCFDGVGVCDVDAGACRYPVRSGSCWDDDPCTDTDGCLADGGCAGTPRSPVAQQGCTHLICNPADGGSIAANRTSGPCDAGRCFTTPGSCDEQSQCAGATPRVCPPTGASCTVPVCDPQTGQCTTAYAAPGTPCAHVDPCVKGECLANGYCGDTGYDMPDGFDAGANGMLRCCGGNAADITTSPNHCGGCFRSCPSGSCVGCGNSGRCSCSSSNCPLNETCENNTCTPQASTCSAGQELFICGGTAICTYL